MTSYGDDEIARLKREEMGRYERLQLTGTMPERARYMAESKPNRKERRKRDAIVQDRRSCLTD